jgi:hypothetical protein
VSGLAPDEFMRPEGTPGFPLSLQDVFIFTTGTRHAVPGLISSVAPRPPKGALKILPNINVEEANFIHPAPQGGSLTGGSKAGAPTAFTWRLNKWPPLVA